MSLTKVSYSMIKGACANVLDFGAVGDGTTNDTAAIQAAVDSLASTGGAVYFPTGTYKVVPPTATTGCIWVHYNNITLFGDGAASVITTGTSNSAVPIHVCSSNDLSISPSSISTAVQNFVCHDLAVNGSGVSTYYALAYGRGILMRVVTNAIVEDCFVTNMSMIGICSEGGNGKFLVNGNIVTNCFYSAINYNGRSYQSIISNNICFGSNASVNSVAIQANGPCTIENNTVYGSPGDFANCGGIMWGEGPYSGVGIISGNIVKQCRFGIKTIYNGPCTITNNLIVNCLTLGGIVLVGGTATSFPVGSTDNIVANNTLINNYPTQIDCSAPNSIIDGNRLLGNYVATNPSGSTEPDAIITYIPEIAIAIGANYCAITCNIINGSVRGIVQTEGNILGVVANNDMYGISAGNMAVATATSVICATTGLVNRIADGTGLYQSQLIALSKPTEGFWVAGDIWNRYPLVTSSTLGAVVLAVVSTTTTATAIAGATSITTAAAPSAAAGNILGIQLDNGAYHWTTTTSVVGATVNFSAAIPVGRSVANGAKVYGQEWRDLAVLA
jgi:hypothetical protein